MKNRTILIALLTVFTVANSQMLKKIDFFKSMENVNSYSDENGTMFHFNIYNKYDSIGIGGGWFIYKEGNMNLSKQLRELYPDKKNVEWAFIKDKLINTNKIDTNILNDFIVYLYLIDSKNLEYKLNTDGEGAGKTYSYYVSYPAVISVYKETDKKNVFEELNSYIINNEEEERNINKKISEFQMKTHENSNK